MQGKFRAEYLQGLPDLHAAIQTQDKFEGEAKNVWCMIKAKPLDRYRPNGKIATYGNDKEIADSNEWTYKKIGELEKRGKSAEEIDREINLFLYGQDITASTKVNLKKRMNHSLKRPKKRRRKRNRSLRKLKRRRKRNRSLRKLKRRRKRNRSLRKLKRRRKRNRSLRKLKRRRKRNRSLRKLKRRRKRNRSLRKLKRRRKRNRSLRKLKRRRKRNRSLRKLKRWRKRNRSLRKLKRRRKRNRSLRKPKRRRERNRLSLWICLFPGIWRTPIIFFKEKEEINYPFETGMTIKKSIPLKLKMRNYRK